MTYSLSPVNPFRMVQC